MLGIRFGKHLGKTPRHVSHIMIMYPHAIQSARTCRRNWTPMDQHCSQSHHLSANGPHRLPRDTANGANMPRTERMCAMCALGLIDDEKHLMFECSVVQHIRDWYEHSIQTSQRHHATIHVAAGQSVTHQIGIRRHLACRVSYLLAPMFLGWEQHLRSFIVVLRQWRT